MHSDHLALLGFHHLRHVIRHISHFHRRFPHQAFRCLRDIVHIPQRMRNGIDRYSETGGNCL